MKKFLLKNAMLIIAILLSIGTIALCIWNLRQTSSNAARLEGIVSFLKAETLPEYRDSLIKELEIRKFKEDYFVEQVNIQSDWIILYVSALFILFGIFGFGTFIREYQEVKQDNEKFKQDYSHKQNILHDEFSNFKNFIKSDFDNLKIKLENDFSGLNRQVLNQASNLSWIASVSFFREGLTYESIKSGLMSISYRMMAINGPEFEKYKPEIIEIANTYLDSILGTISSDTYIEEIKNSLLITKNYEIIFNVLEDILKFENRGIKEKTIDIISLLKAIRNDTQK